MAWNEMKPLALLRPTPPTTISSRSCAPYPQQLASLHKCRLRRRSYRLLCSSSPPEPVRFFGTLPYSTLLSSLNFLLGNLKNSVSQMTPESSGSQLEYKPGVFDDVLLNLFRSKMVQVIFPRCLLLLCLPEFSVSFCREIFYLGMMRRLNCKPTRILNKKKNRCSV